MQNEGQLKAHHGISARPDPPKSKLPFGLTGDRFTLYAAILASLVFTLVIWLVGQRLQDMPHLPYAGFGTYYWQLAGQTTLGKVSAWVLYVLHQLTLWGLIYYAKTRVHRFTSGLHRLNVVALTANGLFILLHLLQTHIWYDGLAPEVSYWSWLGFLAVALVLILMMENGRRGMFFGMKAPLSRNVVNFVRRNHSYFIALAAVYTFWYHPMEPTIAHLTGFFYMFLILIQSSLMYTRIHFNKWWTIVLEVMVLFHTTMVAWYQGNDTWPMFAFGFAGVFVVTQLHGLGLSLRRRLPFYVVYAGMVWTVYLGRGWENLVEIIRIPLFDYVAVFLFASLIGGGLWLSRLATSKRQVAKTGTKT